MSEKVTAMIEEIKGLTVLELSELVHALEEEFGEMEEEVTETLARYVDGHPELFATIVG
jgi:ribosomal protein L7/L12